jgi:hypothetical protein
MLLLPPETIIEEGEFHNIKYLIERNHFFPVAYIGIPKNYQLCKQYSLTLNEIHYGWAILSTWNKLDNNYTWYCWDYGHLGDRTFGDYNYGEREWSSGDIRGEIMTAIDRVNMLEETLRGIV